MTMNYSRRADQHLFLSLPSHGMFVDQGVDGREGKKTGSFHKSLVSPCFLLPLHTSLVARSSSVFSSSALFSLSGQVNVSKHSVFPSIFQGTKRRADLKVCIAVYVE